LTSFRKLLPRLADDSLRDQHRAIVSLPAAERTEWAQSAITRALEREMNQRGIPFKPIYAPPGDERHEARSKKFAKASELAEQIVERLIDPAAPPEQRERSKRRLIKGPKEFRDIRKKPR
jgi:hypothetical protein